MAFREIENVMSLEEPVDKCRMLHTLLKGQALFYFEHHLRRMMKAEYLDLLDNDFIELVLIHRFRIHP
jgi:hypothetical protein